MLYREIIAVCFEIHTKHINTLCGQNAESVYVKPGGTYSDHCTVWVNTSTTPVYREWHRPFNIILNSKAPQIYSPLCNLPVHFH